MLTLLFHLRFRWLKNHANLTPENHRVRANKLTESVRYRLDHGEDL